MWLPTSLAHKESRCILEASWAMNSHASRPFELLLSLDDAHHLIHPCRDSSLIVHSRSYLTMRHNNNLNSCNPCSSCIFFEASFAGRAENHSRSQSFSPKKNNQLQHRAHSRPPNARTSLPICQGSLTSALCSDTTSGRELPTTPFEGIGWNPQGSKGPAQE